MSRNLAPLMVPGLHGDSGVGATEDQASSPSAPVAGDAAIALLGATTDDAAAVPRTLSDSSAHQRTGQGAPSSPGAPPAGAGRAPLFLVPDSSSLSPVESARLEVCSTAQQQQQEEEAELQQGIAAVPGDPPAPRGRPPPILPDAGPRAWAEVGPASSARSPGPRLGLGAGIRWRSPAGGSLPYGGGSAALPGRGSVKRKLRVVLPPGRQDSMARLYDKRPPPPPLDTLVAARERGDFDLRSFGVTLLQRQVSTTTSATTTASPRHQHDVGQAPPSPPAVRPLHPPQQDPDQQDQVQEDPDTDQQRQPQPSEAQWLEGPVPAHQVFELGSANPLWRGFSHTLKVGQTLPAACGGETTMYTFVAAPDHFACRRPDYLRAVFEHQTQVFVLLPSTNPIPQWLLRDFNLLPASEASLEVDWRLGWPWSALAVVDRRMAALVGSRLVVWERKAIVEAGREVVFGGTEGSIPDEDYTYLLAWHAVKLLFDDDDEEEAEARGVRRRSVEAASSKAPAFRFGTKLTATMAGMKMTQAPEAPGRRLDVSEMGLDREEDRNDPLALMCHVLNAVLGSELGHLKTAMSLYMRGFRAAAAADRSGLIAEWPAPVFRTREGELLTRAAIGYRAPRHSAVQLAIVTYLVWHGAELDAEGFRYVVTNCRAIARCGGGPYRDLRHFALSYVARQRCPVASAMAMAQVLTECAEEDRAQAKGWRDLADTLRGLVVRLLDCLEALQQPEPEPEQDSGEAEEQELGGQGPMLPPEPARVTLGRAGQDSDERPRGRDHGGDGDGGNRTGGRGRAVGPLEGLSTAAILAAIGQILDPRPGRREGGGGGSADGDNNDEGPINDARPLQIAYVTKDLDFISAPAVQTYLRDSWLGPDYIAQALEETGFVFSEKDHHRLLRLLEDLGFVGGLGRPVMRVLSEVVHVQVYCGRAFFDSPRGRWVFQLLTEAFFVYIYHAVQLGTDEASLTWQQVVLLLYVSGMAVDELQELLYQYDGHVSQYISSGINMADSLCLSMLACCIGLKIGMWSLPHGQANPAWADLWTAKQVLYNGAAFLVWGRLLPYLIPLHRGVGSYLMVMKQMFWELLAFAVIFVFLLTGITFSLYGMFRERGISGLGSFPVIMLGLFRTFLGETLFDLFPEDPDILYNLYGSIITVLYVLLAAIVLANLLIALMTAHFESDKLDSQSRFEMAKILAHYANQAERHLLVAPFSVPLLGLRGLLRVPSGSRTRDGRWRRVLGLLPLPPPDGPTGRRDAAEDAAGSAAGADDGCCPTGSNELPYVVYLLVVQPVLLVISCVLYFGTAPYCLLYFAFIGYKNVARILPQLLPASILACFRIFGGRQDDDDGNGGDGGKLRGAGRDDDDGDDGDSDDGSRDNPARRDDERNSGVGVSAAAAPRNAWRTASLYDDDGGASSTAPLMRASGGGGPPGARPLLRPPSHLPLSSQSTAAGAASSSAAAAEGGRRQRRGFLSRPPPMRFRGPGATAEATEGGDDAAPSAPPPSVHAGEDASTALSPDNSSELEALPPEPLAPRVVGPAPPQPQAASADTVAAGSETAAAAAARPTAVQAPFLRQTPELVPEERTSAPGSPGPASPPFGIHPVSLGGLPGIVRSTAEAEGPGIITPEAEAEGEIIAAAEEDGVASPARVRARPRLGGEASAASLPTPVVPQLPTEPGTPAEPASRAASSLPPRIFVPWEHGLPLHRYSPAGRQAGAELRRRGSAEGRSSRAPAQPPPVVLWRRALQLWRYVATRPLYFALGCVVYLALGLAVLVLWLGCAVWPGKLAFHGYWVLRPWLQQVSISLGFFFGSCRRRSGSGNSSSNDRSRGVPSSRRRASRRRSNEAESGRGDGEVRRKGAVAAGGTDMSTGTQQQQVFTRAAITDALQAVGVSQREAEELTRPSDDDGPQDEELAARDDDDDGGGGGDATAAAAAAPGGWRFGQSSAAAGPSTRAAEA